MAIMKKMLCLVLALAPIFTAHSFVRTALHNRHSKIFCQVREAQMSVDELKGELDVRTVDYEDCFSKTELVDRLVQSRASGRASPEILDKFAELDQISVDEMESVTSEGFGAVGGDGALPGGLDPAIMKSLASDKEIIKFLKDPKMQEVMKSVMEGGPDAMKKYLADPDAMLMLGKLSGVINKSMKDQ